MDCPNCGEPMQKTTRHEGTVEAVGLALLLIGGGAIVFCAVPVVGWVLGPLMCIVALAQGGKKYKLWRCRECSMEYFRYK